MGKVSVTLEGDKTLVIKLPIDPSVSKSGKSLVIASTRGSLQTEVKYKGKPITVGVNAYVKNGEDKE